MTAPSQPVVVIGVGSEFRRDDGVGPAVVARLRDRLPPGVTALASDGEPAGLLDAWAGAPVVILVDAMTGGGGPAGRLYRLVLEGAQSASAQPGRAAEASLHSSHGLGLATAVGLAHALHQMPRRLIVHGIEAAEVGQGVGFSPAVEAAIDELAAAVLSDALEAVQARA